MTTKTFTSVLDSVESAVAKAKYVRIHHDKIVEFVKSFEHKNVSHWLRNTPLSFDHLSEQEKLNFLLVFNAISFCYWGEPKWTIEYKGEKYDGAWGMIVALLRANENGIPILDASYRVSMSEDDFSRILAGNATIPLFDDRLHITREVASQLISGYGGSFVEFLKAADGDAMKLLDLIVKTFRSFNDTAIYYNQWIYFYKRAQLLVSDIYHVFEGKGYGDLSNIDRFTACADYKLPQSLRSLGIIWYTKSLEEKVDHKIELIHGEQEEVDIRTSTIWAVELIRQELVKLDKPASTMEINDHLWLMGQDKSLDKKPYHRTVTTAY